MRFVYKGDENGQGPERVTFRAYVFERGVPVDVPDSDTDTIARLQGNSHFSVPRGRPPKTKEE